MTRIIPQNQQPEPNATPAHSAATATETRHKHDIRGIIKAHLPDLHPYEAQYKDFHRHPELGTTESRTAAIVARHLRALRLDAVHANVGGHGVVGVLKNGPGPVVLLRADMDALPVLEATGLPYASRARQKNGAGEDVPVFHACGHDMHTTALLAATAALLAARSEWAGTLVALFQPNEEGGGGAQAMVDDGLYQLIGPPDVILGQHVNGERAGSLQIRSGACMAAADSWAVTIHGKGAHGSAPHRAIDPIVIAGYVIVRLQSIVARRIAPLDTAVVTVGSVHGGQAENIIPDSVTLKINLRSYSAETRKLINDAVKEIVRDECRAGGATREPTFERISAFPVTDNDAATAEMVQSALGNFFGGDRVQEMEKSPGSEDFSNLAAPHRTPYAFWFFGGTDPDVYDRKKKEGRLDEIPSNHMATFAPVIQPTLETAVQALAAAALTALGRRQN